MTHKSALEIRFVLGSPAKEERSSKSVKSTAGRLPQITRVMALAIHFDNMLREGQARDYAEIGRLTGLCRERVSQVMRLNYLAPDIQIGVLYLPATVNRYPITETSLRKMASILSWREQRMAWVRLNKRPD